MKQEIGKWQSFECPQATALSVWSSLRQFGCGPRERKDKVRLVFGIAPFKDSDAEFDFQRHYPVWRETDRHLQARPLWGSECPYKMSAYEWKWGLIIGGANMAWLFLSFYFGLHSAGIGMLQVVLMVAFGITLIGYVLAFRAIWKSRPELHFFEGLKSGAAISIVAACLAILSQVMYFQWINPGWADQMLVQTREYLTAEGFNVAQVEEKVALVKTTFSLRSHTIQAAVQAGLGALVQGLLFSAMIMGVIWWRERR